MRAQLAAFIILSAPALAHADGALVIGKAGFQYSYGNSMNQRDVVSAVDAARRACPFSQCRVATTYKDRCIAIAATADNSELFYDTANTWEEASDRVRVLCLYAGRQCTVRESGCDGNPAKPQLVAATPEVVTKERVVERVVTREVPPPLTWERWLDDANTLLFRAYLNTTGTLDANRTYIWIGLLVLLLILAASILVWRVVKLERRIADMRTAPLAHAVAEALDLDAPNDNAPIQRTHREPPAADTSGRIIDTVMRKRALHDAPVERVQRSTSFDI